MSRSVLAATPARRTAALLATATTTFGLLTLAAPAHADSPAAGGTVTTLASARDVLDRQLGSVTLDTLAPAPTVTGIEPGHGPLAGGATVTISGTHLTGATGVSFGSVPATGFTVDSDTSITATAPAGTAPGAVAVAVTTPGGTSSTGQFTYDAPPAMMYTFTETSDPKSGSVVHPGDKVTYTVTVVQHGNRAVKELGILDDLSQVLDDADYNGDVKADSGTAEVRNGRMLWTGDLSVGGRATITYSVTVNGKGDRRLSTSVTAPDDARGDCETQKGCATDLTVKDAVTPSPSPSSTGGSQTPGTHSPSASASSTTPSSPDTQTPSASATPQTSGVLASTGATVLGTAAAGGALLLVGGLTVVLSRRKARHN
ncbi:IPT/TIG domain-containing protein [Kitasatospora sp. NPDC059673]|uniref:DUF7927 domain-containing protein n=1 Tax=Kitasatospora sp. NPDC059673 TaxID=3346901 RepID=UPI0036C24288